MRRTLEAAGVALAVAPDVARAAPSSAGPQSVASPTPPAATVQPQAEPAPTFGTEVVRQHFEVMNEFLASQSRIIDLVLAAVNGHAPTTSSSLPVALLGEAVDRHPSPIEIRRRFTPERDPILGQHSLGPHLRRQPAGTAPLAVMPFTFSMAIAADAALELLGGGVVTSMRDIRGYRWLALDRGSLDLTIHAEVRSATPPVAVVRLFELTDDRRALAFEADVEVAPAFGRRTEIAQLTRTIPARRSTWSAAQFYRDFAFHGPAFQAIRSVEGFDSQRITARPRYRLRHQAATTVVAPMPRISIPGFWIPPVSSWGSGCWSRAGSFSASSRFT